MIDPATAGAKFDADRLARLVNGIQKSVAWRDRPVIAETLAGCTNNVLPREAASLRPELQTRADALKRDGIAYLGRLLTPSQVSDIHAYLKPKPCYTGHVAAYGDGVGRTV